MRGIIIRVLTAILLSFLFAMIGGIYEAVAKKEIHTVIYGVIGFLIGVTTFLYYNIIEEKTKR